MALNRTKVLETAQKYLAKGQYDRAIAEYQKLVDADPNDVRTWLKIGDLYTRKGSRPEACETYSKVARQYANQGFFLKAVAVYKQILKLDPSRLQVSLSLGEMYEKLQLVSDALSTYEHVASTYARNGDIEAALETLGKMADLDPDNVPVRIKYAEALSKAGRTEDAATSFEIGAELLRTQGRIDDYIKVAERLLYHRTDDVELARKLAELYLDRNDAKRALGKLQLCFKANPRDVATLELLARAFESLGQLPKTISVYREVARIHQEAGRDEERAVVLKNILQLDPGDAEARQALARYAPRPEEPAAAAPVAAPEPEEDDDVEFIDDDDDIEIIEDDEFLEEGLDEEEQVLLVDEDDDEDVLQPKPEPVAATEPEPDTEPLPAPARVQEVAPTPAPVSVSPDQTAKVPSIPPDVAREAQIARLLTECEVFLRYGLKAKVVEQLRKVIEIAPDHVEARERLKDTLLDQGITAEAIEQLYHLANLFEADNSEVAESYYSQILALDPASEPARSRAGGDDLGDTTAAGDDPPIYIDDVQEPDLITMDAIVPIEEGAPAYLSAPEPAQEDDVVGATPPGFEGEHDVLAPMSPEEFEAGPVAAEEAAVQRPSMPPGEVEEILEEAEFFVAQGLYSEARGTLQEALSSYPDHPILVDKITELTQLEAAQNAAEAELAEDDEDESFLLAEKLAEELGPVEDATKAGSDVLDVESVFAQFKRGVQEQIGLEDTDTHFDLGIAYKEMGLLDDAIHEFDLSKSNPHRECIAYTMIGLCQIEKGAISEAIAYFKKGLYSDQKTDREELGLYFELGLAYELLHDPKEALYYYQKVMKREGGFRNVAGKVKSLTSPKSAPPPAAEPSIDDVDQAFDDLMGDD